MIGLDTKVIVRFLAQDNDVQSPLVNQVFSRLTRDEKGSISAAVLAEVCRVLARACNSSREEIGAATEGLLSSAAIMIESAEAAWSAVGVYLSRASVEFADALIAETAALAGATETVTFDRRAAAEAGMSLLR